MRPVHALLPLGFTLLVSTGCRIETEDTGNRAPLAPEISISPNPANTLDDLTVVLDVESADPDGDEVLYEYVWRRDGNVEDITEATVPADLTLKGQLWQVSVTATDGEQASEPATASLTLGNAAPTIGNLTITPDTPTAIDTLQCIAQDVVDPDVQVAAAFAHILRHALPERRFVMAHRQMFTKLGMRSFLKPVELKLCADHLHAARLSEPLPFCLKERSFWHKHSDFRWFKIQPRAQGATHFEDD